MRCFVFDPLPALTTILLFCAGVINVVADTYRQSYPSSESLPCVLTSRSNTAPPYHLGSAPPECSPPPIPAFPPRPKFTTSPLNKEPPPAYSRTQESSPKSGVRERLDRPPPYSRIPQQSTFGTSIPKTSMYKAESMTLETMRGGDRSNHSSFFPEQGEYKIYIDTIICFNKKNISMITSINHSEVKNA